jgi:hypothetical protein
MVERARMQRKALGCRRWRVLALASGTMLCGAGVGQALADPQPVVFNGMPVQVIPTYPEVGLGNYTPPSTGTSSINGGSSTTSTGSGTATTTGDGSSALDTMTSQSWGLQAQQNAQALGVNPSALAATCVVESGCQNLYTASGSNTITGAFQMSNGTYNAALNEALAADPSLASSITSGTAGQQDPATQAVAAAQYLKDAATALQNYGVSDPTALDARAYYNFGPQTGIDIDTASSSEPMSTYLSSSTMSANGISSGETVGEWKASVAAKMGSAASSSILTG